MSNQVIRQHDDHQTRVTICFIAGAIEGSLHSNPGLTVSDVLDMLKDFSEHYRERSYDSLLNSLTKEAQSDSELHKEKSDVEIPASVQRPAENGDRRDSS